MGEDLSPSCRSLSASCILPFFAAPHPPHTPSSTPLTFTPHSPRHLSSSLSSPWRGAPSLCPPPPNTPPHSPNHPSPPPSSRPHVNWFSLCVMQMFGMVSVAFLDGIHFAFNKTDSDGVCSHGLRPPPTARLRVVWLLSPEWVAMESTEKNKTKVGRSWVGN